MGKFDYIVEKIKNAKWETYPCKHLAIHNFLSKEHLGLILNDNQIHFREVITDEELIKKLQMKEYKINKFPGCVTDLKYYFKCVKNNNFPIDHSILEAFGVMFRLKKYRSDFLKELMAFFNGPKFKKALEEKFNVKGQTTIITAIQKYLDRYEISPHPDLRQKCLTYLVNINKDDSIEKYDIHTQLSEFKNEYKFIYDYWKNETKINRCWVPWDWVNIVKTFRKNNIFMAFAPNNDTLHSVKLRYDHKKFQRTQLYGNLMYKSPPKYVHANHRQLIEYMEKHNINKKEKE